MAAGGCGCIDRRVVCVGVGINTGGAPAIAASQWCDEELGVDYMFVFMYCVRLLKIFVLHGT